MRPSERAKTSSTASGESAWVEMARVALGLDLAENEGGGRVLAGVEEEGQLGAVEIERVLDLQLKILDRRDVREAHARDPFEQQRPEAVVAARVVAPAENDEAHHSAAVIARSAATKQSRSLRGGPWIASLRSQ